MCLDPVVVIEGQAKSGRKVAFSPKLLAQISIIKTLLLT